jgi:hypothetical protein
MAIETIRSEKEFCVSYNIGFCWFINFFFEWQKKVYTLLNPFIARAQNPV